MHERILTVDDNNEPIGHATKQIIWNRGLWHRIVRVILIDSKGRFVSQQRAHDTELYPDYWTDTASGHVDEGESNFDAAKRELMEETGLTTPLIYAGMFAFKDIFEGKKVYNFNMVYTGTLQDDLMPHRTEEAQAFQPLAFTQVYDPSSTVAFTPTLPQTLELVNGQE